jgi:hypothetical protein
MKRIAWLLLAVICMSFVQVQPLEPLKARTCRCSHCKAPGSCGMPGCAQAACPAGPVVTTAGEPSRAAAVAPRKERQSVPARMEWFLIPARPAILPLLPVAATFAANGPRVPLFRAHCSLLI